MIRIAMNSPVRSVAFSVLSAAMLISCGQQKAESPAPAADSAAVEEAPAASTPAPEANMTPAPAAKGELVEVLLCDNETKTTAVADGTRESGQSIADELMAQWKRKNPDAEWIDKELEMHQVKPPADNRDVVGKGQGSTYSRITETDAALWAQETYKLAVEGSTIFHSGDKLGSTIAVSCDMCHPDASNTHPETYPKFQEQLGQVAMLRDMINWCIEHPVRGERLDPDSAEMRALEAYIIAQRQGTPLQYGKR
ncbi:MAG: hypothetical protein VX640_00210 [Pseudomonadota bacterium]|nr:hypothetical protein [Pseudomonadota bacterium]